MVSGGASHAADDPPTARTIVDGVTAPVFEYADAIRETVWVTARTSTVTARRSASPPTLIRPREARRHRTDPGRSWTPAPTTSASARQRQRVQVLRRGGKPAKILLFCDNYFVPRGYAFVAPDMASAGRSTGCADRGGRSDIESIKVVIEWLNGNAVARNAAGEVVEARGATDAPA